MTRTISLIFGIAVAALVVGVPTAFGEGRLAGSNDLGTVDPRSSQSIAVEKTVFSKGRVSGSNGTTLPQPDPMIEDGFAQAVTAKQALQSPIVSERTVEPQWLRAERLRGEALNRKYQLGEFAPSTVSTYKDAGERIVEPQYLQALRARGEGLNRTYNLGEFATVNGYVDANERVTPPASSTPVSATTSDREVEWPQVGVGFGIGILLILGLGLAMRAAHVRPFAH